MLVLMKVIGKMAIRVEWTKFTRDIHGVYLALRTSIGMVTTRTRRAGKKDRMVQPLKIRRIRPRDFSMLADLERRRNLAYLSNARNQLR